MIVSGLPDREDEWVDYPVVRCAPDGGMTSVMEPLQEEDILEIDIDGEVAMRTRCSANHLVELVVGRLVTTGKVASVDGIESLVLSERPLRANVRLRERLGAEAAVPSAEGENSPVGNEGARQLLAFRPKKENPPVGDEGLPAEGFLAPAGGLAPLKPVPWTIEEVFAEARLFAEDRTSHRKTRGTHSAYLFRRGELLYCREDIGRHNAFDKIVGAALLDGVALEECTLFTSGRVPTDMAVKAVRARIPIVVSKAVATVDTVKMARACDLTLVCKATPASVDVVNDPLGVCLP